MPDLVERLRERRVTRWVHGTGDTPRHDGLIVDAECAEAATEIERLRQELGECQVGHETGARAIAENERLLAVVKALELAEEGAKKAFGHVVQKKREAEAECERLRYNLSATHRALTLELQQHKRSHAEVLRLAEKLRKYEPGTPMHLA